MAKAHGPTSVFWFRRDLRLEDNHGLLEAVRANPNLIPLFIFDRDILDQLPSEDARVEFIHHAVTKLRDDLNGRLLVEYGRPQEVFKRLLKEHKISSVFTNEDYEPDARKRDDQIAKLMREHDGEFHAFKDQMIFGPSEVLKDNGTPYQVYGAYARKWRARLKDNPIKIYPSAKAVSEWLKESGATSASAKSLYGKMPSLKDIGFKPTGREFPSAKPNTSKIKVYADHRDQMGEDATSHLGLHLRFGTISVRELVQQTSKLSDVYLSELIWREFFMQILAHFPHTTTKPFDARYANIQWRNDKKEFKAWCEGRTGYPIVDAGMREINATGFMHNRARMIVASFLTKHLLVDWRWGERYFAEKLLDYELASNVGNWQWAAGSGCDAAPYFRVFNPTLQQKKFDSKGEYVKRWVPEYQTDKYPDPIVDHEHARRRVLKVFQDALKKGIKT